MTPNKVTIEITASTVKTTCWADQTELATYKWSKAEFGWRGEREDWHDKLQAIEENDEDFEEFAEVLEDETCLTNIGRALASINFWEGE